MWKRNKEYVVYKVKISRLKEKKEDAYNSAISEKRKGNFSGER
jgi:hypothetical protein